jgi:hypothetical protein
VFVSSSHHNGLRGDAGGYLNVMTTVNNTVSTRFRKSVATAVVNPLDSILSIHNELKVWPSPAVFWFFSRCYPPCFAAKSWRARTGVEAVQRAQAEFTRFAKEISVQAGHERGNLEINYQRPLPR